MTAACINGASVKILRTMANNHKAQTSPAQRLLTSITKSRAPKINLGVVTKPEVAKWMIEAVIHQPQFKTKAGLFAHVNWSNAKEVTKAFRRLIDILEAENNA